MNNTTLLDLAVAMAWFLIYYGIGLYALRREIELFKKTTEKWDGLAKFSVFKMVLFFPLQIYFAKKRVEGLRK